MDRSPWNAFEITKLIVSTLTPILVLVLGIVINNSIKSAERSSDLRSKIYEKVGGDINDIYCYLAFVGDWKNMTPLNVIEKKRSVDRSMHVYKPFFSKELFATYQEFIDASFRTWQKAGTDAKIRSPIKSDDGNRVEDAPGWLPAWETRFTGETEQKQIQTDTYNRFLEQLARDLKL